MQGREQNVSLKPSLAFIWKPGLSKALFCVLEALCQDEEGIAYFDGATWSVGDCIYCICDKGIISCSRWILFITSDELKTEHCSQTGCNVAAFLKKNKRICKGKYGIISFNYRRYFLSLLLLLNWMPVWHRIPLPSTGLQNLAGWGNSQYYSGTLVIGKHSSKSFQPLMPWHTPTAFRKGVCHWIRMRNKLSTDHFTVLLLPP